MDIQNKIRELVNELDIKELKKIEEYLPLHIRHLAINYNININYLFGIIYKHNKHLFTRNQLGEFAIKVLENYNIVKNVNYLEKHLTDRPKKIDTNIFSPYVIDFHWKN